MLAGFVLKTGFIGHFDTARDFTDTPLITIMD
jgi:hypothetical protein